MSDRPSLPAVGEVIAGKYAIARVVGKGAMGIVFEAVHLRLSQRVAIKMVRPTHRDLQEIVPRFEREARATAQLQSPYVMRVMDVDVLPDGIPFMVMEYLEGHDLAAELRARGALPVWEAVTYILQVCEALREAHGLGIVHRDIKPSNLFLTRSGEGRIIKLLDFGISKMPVSGTEVDETSAFSTFGTPLYMSPEQMRSARYVDGRSDIWSLGVVLYKMLTMRMPFRGENAMAIATSVAADEPPPLRQWRPDVPEGLEYAVLTALAKNPDGRFQDVVAFAQAIAPFAVPTEAEYAGVAPERQSAAPALHAESQPPTLTGTHPTAAPGTASTWSTAPQSDGLGHKLSRWLPFALPVTALLLGGVVAMRYFHVLAWGVPEGLPNPRDRVAAAPAATAAAPAVTAGASAATAAAPTATAAAPTATAAAPTATAAALTATAAAPTATAAAPAATAAAPAATAAAPAATAAAPTATAAAPAATAAAPAATAAAPAATAAAPAATAAAPAATAAAPAGTAGAPAREGKWITIDDWMWLAAPLKRAGTDNYEGFVSLEAARKACRERADAQVPTPDAFNMLTLDGKGLRQDPEKIRLFDGGRIPIGLYWIDDGSTYGSIRGLQTAAVIKSDGAYATVAYVLCVKNRYNVDDVQ